MYTVGEGKVKGTCTFTLCNAFLKKNNRKKKKKGWAIEMERIQKQLPWVKFILPCAPRSPVTLNGGMRMTSWLFFN